MNLIFDVDGTLTAPREKIDKYFLRELEGAAQKHNLFLATGSDYPKTIEQLGVDFVENCITYSFNCSGNSIWEKGKEIFHNEWVLPLGPKTWLEKALERSACPEKTGFHFDVRPGMLNFSIVGRNANTEQRARYAQYDFDTQERRQLSAEFNALFSDKFDITSQVAGATGFDIYPIGYDKSQILKYFDDVPIVFFGDDTGPGGNDKPLADAIIKRSMHDDYVVPVSSPIETRYQLSIL